jgi:hypothetical protein
VGLEREVAGVEEADLGLRDVALEGRNRQEASTWASCGSAAIQLGMS